MSATPSAISAGMWSCAVPRVVVAVMPPPCTPAQVSAACSARSRNGPSTPAPTVAGLWPSCSRSLVSSTRAFQAAPPSPPRWASSMSTADCPASPKSRSGASQGAASAASGAVAWAAARVCWAPAIAVNASCSGAADSISLATSGAAPEVGSADAQNRSISGSR